MRLPKSRLTLITAVLALVLIAIKPYLPPTVQIVLFPSPTPTKTIQPLNHLSIGVVTRVIDGDTIELATGERLRYIGIDTPETKHPSKPVQCFGKEAFEENKRLVEGKTVRLQKDVSEVDKYGRMLRYVYVKTESSPSGIMVNDYLVRNGFAFATTFPPDVAYAELFRLHQREAQINTRGMWKSCSR